MPAKPYETESAVIVKERGTGRPITKKPARSYLACKAHREHFDEDRRKAAAEKQAERERKKAAKAGR